MNQKQTATVAVPTIAINVFNGLPYMLAANEGLCDFVNCDCVNGLIYHEAGAKGERAIMKMPQASIKFYEPWMKKGWFCILGGIRNNKKTFCYTIITSSSESFDWLVMISLQDSLICIVHDHNISFLVRIKCKFTWEYLNAEPRQELRDKPFPIVQCIWSKMEVKLHSNASHVLNV